MVNDAEKYKDEDDKQRQRISTKNQLESYAFNVKSTVDDEKLKDKITESDKKVLIDKADEMIKWIDTNQLAEKEEFEYKQKEMEGVCSPIMTKLYQSADGAGGMPNFGAGGMPGGAGGMPNFGGANMGPGAGPTGNSGPTIEEVD